MVQAAAGARARLERRLRRDRFDGAIAGVGSAAGVRVVVGHWPHSPLGPFTDVMVADASGRRTLLAPSDEVAAYVSSTYTFDRVVVGPVRAEVDDRSWTVTGPDLELRLTLGGRPPLGWLLRLVPRRLATSPGFTRVTDPVARLVLRGVRTRGSAGGGRTETYGAHDLRRVTALVATWEGADLGSLAPVSPEPGFGFGSTPERPSVTRIVTTVEIAAT